MSKRTISVLGDTTCGLYFAIRAVQIGFSVTVYKSKQKSSLESLVQGDLFDLLPEFKKKLAVNPIKNIEYQSPYGNSYSILTSNKTYTINRFQINELLLNKALSLGVDFEDKIVSNITLGNQVVLHTEDDEVPFDFLCDAEEQESQLAKMVGLSLPAHHQLYLLEGHVPEASKNRKAIQFQYDKKSRMYWTISCPAYKYVGMMVDYRHRSSMTKHFTDFLAQQKIQLHKKQWQNRALPLPINSSFYRIPRAGSNWCIVGDAAGFFDPLRFNGLYLSLQTVDLAIQSLNCNDLHLYNRQIKRDFASRLKLIVENRQVLLSPSSIETVLQFKSKHPVMNDIL
jgi:flavin-dependent dehydrogenase